MVARSASGRKSRRPAPAEAVAVRADADEAEPHAGRVAKDVRRRQLLDVAAQILTAQGVEQVQITEVAERAGVSRPLVYRLFPTRQTLVAALLQDFATRLGERFHAALLATLPGTIEEMTRAFVEASCATIAERGAGPWLLLDARADAELGRIGHTILADLLKPWQRRLAELTGLPPRRADNVLWTIVAAGRAALDGWIMGRISRRAAVADATRAVSVLLQAFAWPAPSLPP
jgi:AcrR family transcriptional regulator